MYKTLLMRILGGLALLLSVQAQAQENWQTCSGGTLTLNITGYVDVGRDAVVGDLIGPWFIYDNNAATYNCTNQATAPLQENYWPWGQGTLTVNAGSGVGVWGTIAHDGKQYRVYRVGLGANQVGYIMEWRFGAPPGHPNAIGVPVNTDLGQAHGIEVNHPSSMRSLTAAPAYGHALWVRMVKISDTFPATTTSISFRAAVLGLQTPFVTNVVPPSGSSGVATGNFSWQQQPMTRNMDVQVNFISVNAACTTPPLTVDLGEKAVDQLPNPGPGLDGYTPFTVLFQDCPRYISAMTYKFDPVPSSPAPTNGVLPAIPPSTATGVGVQVAYMNTNQNPYDPGLPPQGPLNFNRVYGNTLATSTAMSTAINQNLPLNHPLLPKHNFNVPLGARMVRMDPNIVPTAGTVVAQMKVVATYK